MVATILFLLTIGCSPMDWSKAAKRQDILVLSFGVVILLIEIYFTLHFEQRCNFESQHCGNEAS
jgi:hypothetical protein